MKLVTVDQANVESKKVFVRGDIDVPLVPFDDTRLKDIWPTIEYLLGKNCQVILAGHLGRPEGKVVPELSSKPVADWVRGKAGDKVQVLENLRFDPREEANDEGYAKELASLAEIYVNEAFASCERTHASIVGVPEFLPHFAGFRLAKEVERLSEILENPKRPLLAIIGGIKIETKRPVIDRMQGLADSVLVGGKLLGREQDDAPEEEILGWQEQIARAQTIVWNGPLGKVEEEKYQAGTKKLVELILENKAAFKVVGGGDTVAFLDKLGVTAKFDWVSSGGGSMLKFLAGEKLPGIEALLL